MQSFFGLVWPLGAATDGIEVGSGEWRVEKYVGERQAQIYLTRRVIFELHWRARFEVAPLCLGPKAR